MLDTFSRSLVLKKLPSPQTHTLFVELVQFQPGLDGTMSTSASAPPTRPQMIMNHHIPPRAQQSNAGLSFSHHSPHGSLSAAHPFESSMAPFAAVPTSGGHAPPPPPWSRWGTMSTPTMPPSTQRRGTGEGRSNGTPQPSASSSKKRKHVEEPPLPQHHHQQQQQQQRPQEPHLHQQHPSEEDMRSMNSSSSYPLKRHAGPLLTPTPLSPPLRSAQPPQQTPQQTLSPSLALIMSPTNQTVHASPPRNHQLPPLRNGSSGSPLLPPVNTLISGDARPV